MARKPDRRRVRISLCSTVMIWQNCHQTSPCGQVSFNFQWHYSRSWSHRNASNTPSRFTLQNLVLLSWLTFKSLHFSPYFDSTIFDVVRGLFDFFLFGLYTLVCTPVGFARMFTVLGQYVVKPQVRWSKWPDPIAYPLTVTLHINTRDMPQASASYHYAFVLCVFIGSSPTWNHVQFWSYTEQCTCHWVSTSPFKLHFSFVATLRLTRAVLPVAAHKKYAYIDSSRVNAPRHLVYLDVYLLLSFFICQCAGLWVIHFVELNR